MASFSYFLRKGKDVARVNVSVSHNGTQHRVTTQWVVANKDVRKNGSIKDRNVADCVEELFIGWREKCNANAMRIAGMDAKQLYNFLTGDEQERWSLDIIEYARADAARLESLGQTGTAKLRLTMVNSLTEFVGTDRLKVEMVTSRFLNEWVQWINNRPAIGKRKKGARAASLYVTQLKAVYNRAKREYNDEEAGVVRIPFNPFARMEKIHTPAPNPRSITLEQIRALIAADGLHGRALFARDIFVLSFMLVGMNAVDLFHCPTPTNGRITYERTKTRTRRADHALISIAIPPEAEELMGRYAGRNGKALDLCDRYSTINNLNAALNKGLKEVGAAIGIEDLSFYSARHTWATLAVNEVGIDKYTVHLALNHVDDKTAITDIYIRKSWDPIDAANRKVLDYVLCKSSED